MYKRILVATDGSELSHVAVQHALRLAQATGAEVVALKVVPKYPQSYFEGSVVLAAEEIEKIEQQWQAEAAAIVGGIQTEANALGVKLHPLTVAADLEAEALIATAQAHKCDLIVMASHGRKGLQRLLLGSETQQVLTHSHIPVLVLR